ncbi:hypothetical protein ALI144C_41605 [Actinosynnema sp. ALI-1.44]|uniref:hypothetical protein n=1 Tax=Actinosynnema sp. ALI-1.44 TaxID=1933779 RepID=UPI00097C4AF9|nr:hypothetical protein [Actinosynnema sp. ALI-1.44]ONI75233.1 hypothetical protein ALI144C_41605 [Actinosynnema sp. ALI-1.44]
MIWIVWRQHRTAIVSTAVLAVAIIVFLIAFGNGFFYRGGWYLDYVPLDPAWKLAPSALGLAVAVFWAAPLIGREYEQRTYLVAWGQDVSLHRWLVRKVLLLAAAAVALSVIVGVIAGGLVDQHTPSRFSFAAFEADPAIQAAHTLFGFAVGLAFSALLRRTLLAMGATLVVVLAAHGLYVVKLRERIIPRSTRSAHGKNPVTRINDRSQTVRGMSTAGMPTRRANRSRSPLRRRRNAGGPVPRPPRPSA